MIKPTVRISDPDEDGNVWLIRTTEDDVELLEIGSLEETAELFRDWLNNPTSA